MIYHIDVIRGDTVAEMVRVNTRISSVLNEWLDEQSKQTGVPKSTIIMLALEQYFQQKEVMKSMSDMGAIMDKLDSLEKAVQRSGTE